MTTAFMRVALSAITVPEGRRAPRNVGELAASIAEVGLLNPITVTSGNRLVAGYHRMEAAKLLGWTEIAATILDGDPLDLELAEIDENLIRDDLTVLEQAQHFTRREQILIERGQRAKAGDNQHTGGGVTVTPPKTTKALAAEIGVSENTLQKRKQIATKIAPEVQEAIQDLPIADHTRDLLDLARAKPEKQVCIAAVLATGTVETVREARQVVREQEHAERDANFVAAPVADMDGPFDVLYVDPPWRYEHSKTDSRAIENHYPTMSLDELCAEGIASIAAPNCVLFCWATSPKLAEAMQVLTAWGFNYRTCAVWVKDVIGLGYYWRQRHELLLLATRGAPETPEPSDRPDSVIMAPRGEADAPFWQDVYRQAFPTMEYTYVIAKDGWAQRGGVDRVVCLESGKQLHIEQKVRQLVYGDILLEYWSNAEARKPGWIAQDALTDYLAYAFLPTKRCYLFDWATLRRAWLHHRGAWVRAGKSNSAGFRHIVARNKGYSTVSVVVPIPTLLAALQSHTLITWNEETA